MLMTRGEHTTVDEDDYTYSEFTRTIPKLNAYA